MPKQFLTIGKIVTTHGVRGEVRLEPWCDSPEDVCRFRTLYLDEGGTRPLGILRARVHKNIVILQLEGIATVEEAARLRGRLLYADRAGFRLPKGRYFIEDLVGLTVLDADTGREYGKLTQVSPTGANDVYHIRDGAGRETLIPAIAQVVVATDVEAGVMRIRPLPGLFDPESIRESDEEG